MTNLELLPARVHSLTSQILHLRTEMRAEFSAVRGEMAAHGAALRQEIAGQGSDLRCDIDGLATQMRVLHKEVIARIALLHEAPRAPSKRREKVSVGPDLDSRTWYGRESGESVASSASCPPRVSR